MSIDYFNEENGLEVSRLLKLVTSYQAALTAGDVTSAVDVLASLLDVLRRSPDKSQDIFQAAMATVNQMTSVKFEELVQSQKINRTTTR